MVKLTSTIYLRFMEAECRSSLALEFSVLSNVKRIVDGDRTNTVFSVNHTIKQLIITLPFSLSLEVLSIIFFNKSFQILAKYKHIGI